LPVEGGKEKKMKIKKKISKYNNSSRGMSIKFIVIHYIGTTSTAKNNAIYFSGGDRQASAHFYVDGEIWQGTKLSRSAWHCGGAKRGTGGGSLYGKVRNANSIGIEMCLKKKDGKLYVTNETKANVKALVTWLMKKYNIPKAKVVRHYDVNGKRCPAAYTEDNFMSTLIDGKRWEDFRNEITAGKPKKKKKYKGLLPNAFISRHAGTKRNIKRWQKFLCWAGYKTAKDGLFGPDCEKQTMAFQGDHGLKKDGLVGPATRGKARKMKK